MQCPVCHHPYNTTRLPTIVSTGQTLCLECNLENQNNSKPIINHSLLALIKNAECCEHKLPLSFYCVEQHKSYCEKCILFPTNPHQNLKSKTIIPHSEFPNIYKGMLQQLGQVSGELKEQINEVKNKKLKVADFMIKNVDNAFIQIMQELNKKKQNMKNQIITTIDNILTSQWLYLGEKLETLNHGLSSLKMIKGSKAISKGIEMVKNYQELGKKLTTSSESLKKELDSIKSCWKWTAKSIKWEGQFEKFSEEISLCLSSGSHEEKKIEDEDLLSLIDMSEGKEKKKQLQWVKAEELQTQKTQGTLNESFISITTVGTKFPQNEKVNSKILSISDKSMIPKVIPSQARTLKLLNLKLTNQQAKDLLNTIKRSFISKLDLTGNKITNSFVLELKKINTGKYLKRIIIAENDIIPSELSFRRKVQQLEKDNLQIVF